MHKRLLIGLVVALALLLGAPSTLATQPANNLSTDRLFDGANTKLTAAGKKALQPWLDWLRSNPKMVATVEVHSDSRGEGGANFRTTQARAKAITDYLKSKGVGILQASPSGRGENTPIADNSTAAGRAKNRRVYFSVQTAAERNAAMAKALGKGGLFAGSKPDTSKIQVKKTAGPPPPGVELLDANIRKTSEAKFGAWTAKKERFGRRVGDPNASFDLNVPEGQSLRVVVTPARDDLHANVTLRSPSGRVVKGTQNLMMGTAAGAWYPWTAVAGSPEEPGTWKVEVGGKTKGQIVEVRLETVQRAPATPASPDLCDRLHALRAHHALDPEYTTVPTQAPNAAGELLLTKEWLLFGAQAGGWNAESKRLEWLVHQGQDAAKAQKLFDDGVAAMRRCRHERESTIGPRKGQLPGAPPGTKAMRFKLAQNKTGRYTDHRVFELMYADLGPNHLLLMVADDVSRSALDD